MALKEISPDKLRIGMFVVLKLSWWKHPFMKGSFRIQSEQQIETIKKLGLKRILFDPDRSVIERKPEASPKPVRPARPEYDDLQKEKEKKFIFLKEKQQKLNHCNRKYNQSLTQVVSITKEVSAGTKEGVDKAQDLMSEVVETLKGDTQSMIHLINLKEMDKVAYFHSLNVCIISLILARDLGMSPGQLSCLGLGALFHDIGKNRIPKKVLLKKPPLSRAEEEYIRLHPQYGHQMLEDLPNFPQDSLDVVMQHHERISGKGYPSGLKGKEINTFAIITSVADLYDNLCNQAHADQNLTPHEALSFIYTRHRNEFPKGILETFIKAMGVYPPGALVELTDESVGMVISTDKNRPLNPTVLIYTDDTALSGPIIVDLQEDHTLEVKRNLRPDDLSDQQREYLHPERAVGFYVHTLGMGKH